MFSGDFPRWPIENKNKSTGGDACVLGVQMWKWAQFSPELVSSYRGSSFRREVYTVLTKLKESLAYTGKV